MTLTSALLQDDAALAMTPILVVDDSRAQRRMLSRTLAKWGYDTVEADSGELALDACRSASFDIVISDWMMPGMSGVEFCRTFREEFDRPAYFILLTAQTEREALAEGLESGADDFLSKPFNAIELRARLRAGERVVQAQRALSEKNAALETALVELSDTYDAIERDLRGARKFQEGLVPERFIQVGPASVTHLLRSSGHVGGDLVGHFRVNQDELVVFSVDVSGHGVASALMTARVAGYLSDAAPDRNIALAKVGKGYALVPFPTVCSRLNAILMSDAESDQYLTLAMAHVNLASGEIEICAAGHPSPAVQRADGAVDFLELWSTPIGLIDNGEFASVTIQLSEGDRLVLYSDGVTECPDEEDQLLDEPGLASIMKNAVGIKGTAFTDRLLSSLVRFHGSEDFPDDVSAVVVDWR
ncbi:MAG: SpoIIE family protein phosphatase [Paracoccaceae bacterium]|nr:SpoIIE family protein phosphatase [Paracoccaceae bacterium]